jgi:hypothetical protein
MPEIEKLDDGSSAPSLTAPWQNLLAAAQEHATLIATDIMTDSVLGESVIRLVSSYLAERDKLVEVRREFACADILCRDLRKEAKELMQSFGFESNWGGDDIRAVDEQLLISMTEAAEAAGVLNKKRTEIAAQEKQLHTRVIDEIALYSSIAVLRATARFGCAGEAFCVAYIATAILREQTIEDEPLSKAIATLSDWLQYAIGAKKRAVEQDIFAHSRIAQGICTGMGIENYNALKLHLIEAVNEVK